VVISAGSKDGVDVGDEFTIYHGNTNIGDVKVEKLQEAMSAAGFISDDIKDKVREGDRAVKKTR
jgi:hypothetical protein